MEIRERIEEDAWTWIRQFVTVPNEFYDFKFAPCPYAKGAIADQAVDVAIWLEGDMRRFIHEQAIGMRDARNLTTRVMVFPPRAQWAWGLSEYVETLNTNLIPHNVFLNTGVMRTTQSRYPGSPADPYFMVVANSLEAVLKGADALDRTNYYKDWPRSHYRIVVERRNRLAQRYGRNAGSPQPFAVERRSKPRS